GRFLHRSRRFTSPSRRGCARHRPQFALPERRPVSPSRDRHRGRTGVPRWPVLDLCDSGALTSTPDRCQTRHSERTLCAVVRSCLCALDRLPVAAAAFGVRCAPLLLRGASRAPPFHVVRRLPFHFCGFYLPTVSERSFRPLLDRSDPRTRWLWTALGLRSAFAQLHAQGRG